MNKLLRKKLTRGGFTLAELLIVVAIIAVLVAIAIPIFTGALEKARLGVHRSNARALKSMGVGLILGDSNFESSSTGNQIWVVAAQYNFTTEKYDNYYVVNQDLLAAGSLFKSAGAGYMYVNTDGSPLGNGTSSVTDINGVSSDKTYRFGTDAGDAAIGKVHTNDKVNYVVVITEQDVENAKVLVAPKAT